MPGGAALPPGSSRAAWTRCNAPARELLAWLGPAIGPAAYEVGPEVREAILSAHPTARAAFTPSSSGADRWLADLYGVAVRQLESLGVDQVYGGGFCTFRDERRFFSFRRDGTTGRFRDPRLDSGRRRFPERWRRVVRPVSARLIPAVASASKRVSGAGARRGPVRRHPFVPGTTAMRPDKLTTKFQMAIADARSLALGHDHQFLEPVHVMAALLDQQGATVRHDPRPCRRQRQRAAFAARHRARFAAARRRYGRRRSRYRMTSSATSTSATSSPSGETTSSSRASCSCWPAWRGAGGSVSCWRETAHRSNRSRGPSTPSAAAMPSPTPMPKSSAERWRSSRSI